MLFFILIDRCVEIPVYMCIKYDTVSNKCLECADKHVMIDYTYTDSVTNKSETTPICVYVNEHLNCECNLLKYNSNKLEVKHIL